MLRADCTERSILCSKVSQRLHYCIWYLIDVLWGQPIKLVQVASTSELLKNQQNNLVFFKIIPSHFCRASEASKFYYFKN